MLQVPENARSLTLFRLSAGFLFWRYVLTQLTSAFVRKRFLYFPFEGVLTCREDHPGIKAGHPVGSIDHHGYLGVTIGDKGRFHIHRVIYLYVYGRLPKNPLQIDHRDQNRLNNRVHNYRVFSEQQQARNRGGRSATGVKGVSAEFRNGGRNEYYRVYISGDDKKQRRLGYTKDLDEAACLRYAAEQCLGWSKCEDLSEAAAYAYVKERIQHRTRVQR